MYKQITFFGKTDSGVFCQALFNESLEKTASALPVDGWETADEIRRYIATITPEDKQKYCYVLVNALGAGEFFGSNINADYFPWDALAHEGDDYGYKTFLRAHAFQHHKNKEPEKAFGIPVVSALNTRMKRVELVIRLDREKARLEGADGIISRIDKGEFPDVSMGCKVPYDVCSICGRHSKTRADYCEHMNPPADKRGIWGPNKILPDGRKIYVLNTFPRFFDISFVFIGADKTAKVMAKLASVGEQTCMGDVCTMDKAASVSSLRAQKVILSKMDDLFKVHRSLKSPKKEQEKTASGGSFGEAQRKVMEFYRDREPQAPCCDGCGEDQLAHAFGVEKKSAQQKVSEIIKNIPAGSFASKGLSQVEGREGTMTPELLDAVARHPMPEIAGTTASLGIVLKPSEFQRVILIKMGEAQLADAFERNGQVFREVQAVDSSLQVDPTCRTPELMDLLSDVAFERTAFGPAFNLRAKLASAPVMVKNPLPTPTRLGNPLLDKISAAYNGYRRDLLTKVSQAVEAVSSDPQLRQSVLGENLSDIFMKTASSSRVLTLESMAYLMGAHLDNRSLHCTTAVAEALAAENGWLLEGA